MTGSITFTLEMGLSGIKLFAWGHRPAAIKPADTLSPAALA